MVRYLYRERENRLPYIIKMWHWLHLLVRKWVIHLFTCFCFQIFYNGHALLFPEKKKKSKLKKRIF